MKKILHPVCFVTAMLFATQTRAQLSGAYTVPGSYATIGAAIADLNTQGVNGAVTINIAAGHTETAPVGGYTLNAISGASSANTIVFQKSGAGLNPLITAYAGGAATPASAIQDGVWIFNGSDYITVDGIDINDPNTSNPATMEFGYGFFKASATDGCNYNTIRNCVITLNRVNNDAGSTPAYDGSRAIDVVNATQQAHTTALTITSAAGSNSNNKFYSNTIRNCNIGISLVGFVDASPFSFADTGNDIGGSSQATGNTIINFGGGGTTAPAWGIRTQAQYGLNVSYNLLNNNTGAGLNHDQDLRGIHLAAAQSANASVTHNTVTLNGGGTTSQVTAIQNSSGSTAASNTITIANNLITNCTYSTAAVASFYGIYNTASAAYLSIANNTLSNNSTNATDGEYYNIINSGNVGTKNEIVNNLIGLGTFSASSTSLGLLGIYNGSGTNSSTLSILSNTLEGANFTGAGTGYVELILNSGRRGVVNINNNNFNNITVNTTSDVFLIDNSSSTRTVNVMNNVVTTGFTIAGPGGGYFFGYYNEGSPGGNGISTISGNKFSNLSLSGASDFYGILDGTTTSQITFITNNVISNVSCASARSFGISHSYGAAGCSVSSNTVSGITGESVCGINLGKYNAATSLTVANNIVSSYTATGTSGEVYGIWHEDGVLSHIYKNKIYDLVGSGTANVAAGLNIDGGTAINAHNNIIGDIQTPTSGQLAIAGIVANGGTNIDLIYNTVNLSGTSTGTDFSSAALLADDSPVLNARNNIFVNNTVPTGTGVAYAYFRTSAIISTYSNSSNNNLFYAGTPSANHLIFYDGTNAVQALGAYKTLMSTRDGSSITENPSFVSVAGSNAGFLNINAVTPTLIESAGSPVAGITTDYAGTTRNATSPDIGAWEGTYTLLDINAPAMVSSGFTTPGCLLTGRTFTASFTDAGGVASAGLSPRIYYKLNAGTYSSVSGTLTSGTANNGVWTFSLTYTGTLLDIVSYYVVVQDGASTPNIAAFPSAGFAGTDVNTVTSDPTTPNTYGINALNGIYTVGASGTFTSLTQAATAYNDYCLNGPVTFSLTDALYSTAETFPIEFKNNPDASATNSLLIIPASGIAVAITPVSTSMSSSIKFSNARYITIDGLNTGGSSIAIHNANTVSSSANIWLASNGTGNNHIHVKNTSLEGADNTLSNGVVASLDGSAPGNTGGADNDNITIEGNTFTNFLDAIRVTGTASVSAGGADNWVITNNLIGPAAAGSDEITGSGISVKGVVGVSVQGNTIRFLNGSGDAIAMKEAVNSSVMTNTMVDVFTTGNGILLSEAATCTVEANLIKGITLDATAVHGIHVRSNVNGVVVSKNTVIDLTNSASTTDANNVVSALYLGNGVINGTVSANVISTVFNNETGGYGIRGLGVNTGNAASNISIINNFIADVYCYGDASSQYWTKGIDIEGATGGINIDNNTVNLERTFAGYNSATGSAALYLASTGGNLVVRNNIFSNTYNNTTVTSDINYAVYSAESATNLVTMNYNDYYAGGTGNNPVMGYLGSDQANLAGIQTAFGGNLNSISVAPLYASATDLHIQQNASNAALENMGTPLAHVGVDIDNQTRHMTTPDIGADEFTIPDCTTADGGILAQASVVACAGQTLVATSVGASNGLTTSYLWKFSTTSGGPYLPVTGGTGSTTTSYTSAPLPTGVYYVVLETTCAAATLTAISNEGTLTVNALPTATAAVTSSAVCSGQNINLSGSSDIGTTYSWTGPNGFASGSQNPIIGNAGINATGHYSLLASDGTCTSTVSTVFVVANPLPPTLTLSPLTASICPGGSQTITSLGGAVNPTLNFGTQANQNSVATSSVSYPAPYSAYYGGQRMQMLIQANELLAAGFIANTPINSVQFPVVSLGSNWGTSINDNQDFQVNIGMTNLTSLSTFQGGLTNVVAPSSFTPVVGYGNTHTFSTPFIWDGVSNVVLETTFSNNFSGTANDFVVQYNSPTNFQSTIVYRADGQTSSAIASNTSVDFMYNLRPDFKLNGTSIGSFSWSPSAGLSGTTHNTVVATPATSSTYTLTSTLGACSTHTDITITIVQPPVVNIAATSTVICAGDAATLTASGADTYSWTSTNTTNTFVVTPSSTTIYTVNAQNFNCAVVNETISIQVNALPVVNAVSSATAVCAGKISTLTASGAVSYSWSTQESTQSVTVAPTSPETYTVTGTDALGCSDDATVSVGINPAAAVIVAPTNTSICLNETATIIASGVDTYTWTGSTTPGATLTVSPALGINVYTVTGSTSLGCSGIQTTTVTVNPLPAVAITPASATICVNETKTFTTSGGGTYNWMPGNVNTATLAANPAASQEYTVTVTDANACKGVATVALTVDPCTGIKTEAGLENAVRIFPNPSTGLIHAVFETEGTKHLTVTNSVGAFITEMESSQTSESFDLSAYAKGIYFLNVRTSTGAANYKIVIQ